jgi:hypothetical protein
MQNKLFGITHDVVTGDPVIRVPRTCKVSIGMPKGKDIHAEYQKGHAEPWVLTVGKYDGNKRVSEGSRRFVTQADVRKAYRDVLPTVPERQFPAKLPYFTFRRIGPDGELEPDWGAIEAHGLRPHILDIIFTDDSPLEAFYEMWGTGKRKCYGDGINALRVLEMAASAEEKQLAEAHKAAGDRYFPIVGGCKCRGCQYAVAKQTQRRLEPPECKPHARLAFQLVNSINLGGKAEFNTTSYRSISQLFSSMSELLKVTGGGKQDAGFLAGIPLQLVLRPYTVTHEGKSSRAWGVHLEFRADSFVGLRQKLLSYGAEFHAALTEQKTLPAPTLEPGEEEMDPQEAAALVAEFYTNDEEETPEGDEDFGGEEQKPTESAQAASATAEKTSALKEKISKRNVRKEEPPAVGAFVQPATTVVTAAPNVETKPSTEDWGF